MQKHLYLIAITGLLVILNCKFSNSVNSWDSVIKQHLQLYPEIQPADIYKMVYQGMLGPGHLGADPKMINKYICMELSEIEPDPDADLIENITPDSHFVRINLKKFLDMNLSVDGLAEVVLRSSGDTGNSKADFIHVWENIVHLVNNGKIAINKGAFNKFNRWAEENNYPVVHHSDVYFDLYLPAYRVVSLSIWKENQRK